MNAVTNVQARRTGAALLCGAGVLLALLAWAAGSGSSSSDPDAPPGPDWSLVNAPSINDGFQTNNLIDVACVATNDCWSVGAKEYDENGHYQTLVQHWNGADWSVVMSPSVAQSAQSQLHAITCNSAADCWAVGYWQDKTGGYPRTLVEHWDGNVWSIISAPNSEAASTSNYLNDVTCTGASACWAVGYTLNNGPAAAATLIEFWDGSSWTIVTSANSVNASTSLTSVSCVSGSDCWAVGASWADASSHQTFVQHWNGTSWSAAVSPNVNLSSSNDLNEVICNSGSDCWAVGQTAIGAGTQTLTEHWNGAAWAIVSSPQLSNLNVLNKVDCAATTDCWAVGYTSGATLIEHWNGSAWSIIGSANVPNQASGLNGVFCMAGADCWAVGSSVATDTYRTLTEHWNGNAWSIVASPTLNNGPRDNRLRGIKCTTPNNCWAVGVYEHEVFRGGVEIHGLFMHWDGTAWGIWGTLGDVSFFEGFFGVDCVASNDCWAVGSQNADNTLTAHWNGTRWSIVSSPDMPDSFNGPNGDLRAVACNSSADCWAVGYWQTQSARLPLIEHWNGAAWSIVAAPDIGPSSGTGLSGVDCTSSTDCFAVGRGDYYHGTVVLHWDGVVWSLQSSLGDGLLDAVACPQANDCWAVGRFSSVNSATPNVMMAHWNGNSWSPQMDVVATGSYDELYGVTCPVPERCYAVGTTLATTMIKEWKNGAWTAVPSENASTEFGYSNYLMGVQCMPGAYCFAVGQSSVSNTAQNLIEGRTLADVSPTPTPVPTPTPSASPTPTPSPAPSAKPVVSVSVSPAVVNEGSDATFTISASPNTTRPVTVFYSFGGKATQAADYTLDITSGQITIEVGHDSATVVLHSVMDGVKEKKETAVMTLSSGNGYSFGAAAGKKKKNIKAPSATVTIISN